MEKKLMLRVKKLDFPPQIGKSFKPSKYRIKNTSLELKAQKVSFYQTRSKPEKLQY